MKNIKRMLAIMASALVLSACDAHKDFIDYSMHVGDVLTTDGDVMRYTDYKNSGKEAIGVVFHVNDEGNVGEGRGYAVYLWDMDGLAYADTVSISQKTGTDVDAYDGNANTYAMMQNTAVGSPLADAVFPMWKMGQSAFIPSVAEMRLLKAHKQEVNSIIERCLGDELPDIADECWYWTSTGVQGQEDYKAWLYSLQSGAIQETPKDQPHKARPIISIRY